VFENRVQRNIFGSERDVIRGQWRRLHKEELYDLHRSPYIIRVSKWRRVRSAGDVACMGQERCRENFCWKDMRERNNLEDLGVDGRIILK